jgi:hypothetical protein
VQDGHAAEVFTVEVPVTSQQCHDRVEEVPREECQEVPRQECHQVPREVTTFKEEQECSVRLDKQCKTVQKQVCY